MKKYIILVLSAIFIASCSFTATPTVVPTLPTPVGYGVEFPFDPIKEWGDNVNLALSEEFERWTIYDETVKAIVESNGKFQENESIAWWSGNVPLELFYVPEVGSPNYYLANYDIWGTNYLVRDTNSGYEINIIVITKIAPSQ